MHLFDSFGLEVQLSEDQGASPGTTKEPALGPEEVRNKFEVQT